MVRRDIFPQSCSRFQTEPYDDRSAFCRGQSIRDPMNQAATTPQQPAQYINFVQYNVCGNSQVVHVVIGQFCCALSLPLP